MNELLIDRQGPLLRAALVRDGVLVDLQLDRAGRPSRLGAVYRAPVVRLATAMNVAFVDLGGSPHALLAASDIRPQRRKGEARIGQLLTAGRDVLVQVKADAHGAKGPVVTMDATLPGRFLVHVPFRAGITASRRLGATRAGLLARVTTILDAAGWPRDGWIVRSGAEAADDATLAAEATSLAGTWRALSADPAPGLKLPAPDAVRRAITEQGGRGIDRILAADPADAAALTIWARDAAPDLAGRIAAAPEGCRLFDRHDLDRVIAGLGERVVPLPDGGSLVIDRTEALHVIDVNGGERGDPMAVNLQAAREIARQIRLRNLGGIVIVDFISIRARGHGGAHGVGHGGDRERLLAALTGSVADDPAGTQVYGMSALGLVEMTRTRRGPALADLLKEGGE